MKKGLTTIQDMSDRANDDFIAGSVARRISLVWPLTQEIASLNSRATVI